MVRPDLEKFRALAAQRKGVPLVHELLADLDTPLGAFLKLDDAETSFLFESVEGGEDWGRFSFMGIGTRAALVSRAGSVEIRRGDRREQRDAGADPLDTLRELIAEFAPVESEALPPLAGGAVGYLSYDWVRYVEKLPDTNPDPLGVPECFFRFPEILLVHDRKEQKLKIVHIVDVAAEGSVDEVYAAGVARIQAIEAKLRAPLVREEAHGTSEVFQGPESNTTREQYHDMVKSAKEYIHAGDVFQVVLSQRFSAEWSHDPVEVYRQLRSINPSPYLFFMRCDDHVILGSSPEILVRLQANEIHLRPIAGTRPRGETDTEDQALERELLADPKELAEHVMLVDLGRNDVGRVAEIDTVRVDEFKVVERYSHVMHIVSNVRGKLREGHDAVDLLRATFPAGTLTGAPKIRAMEIIDELESVRRGLYGGSVGYIDHRGNMDMCIAIRTLLIKEGQVHIQAGGGIVADSDPEAEYQETWHKASALLQALQRAANGRDA